MVQDHIVQIIMPMLGAQLAESAIKSAANLNQVTSYFACVPGGWPAGDLNQVRQGAPPD
jgi:uncharacterized membrane protein AbrB (regulator of aidB expression)